MPTRLKRPSIFKQLLLTFALVGFLTYMGISAFGGQYGFDSKREMLDEIDVLSAQKAQLQAEVDAIRHRISLFDANKIDPDILTERAKSLLSMARPDDIVVIEKSTHNNL